MGNLVDRIEINAAVMAGKPVIRGTRITVEHILDELDAGADPIDLVKHGHPELELDDVLACVEYSKRAGRAVSR